MINVTHAVTLSLIWWKEGHCLTWVSCPGSSRSDLWYHCLGPVGGRACGFYNPQMCLTSVSLLVLLHGNGGKLVFLGLSSLHSTLSRLRVSFSCGEEKRWRDVHFSWGPCEEGRRRVFQGGEGSNHRGFGTFGSWIVVLDGG